MITRVRVDRKGRVVLPKDVREALGIREGDEVVLVLRGGRVCIERVEDPYRVLEDVLGDLVFSRGLRAMAEREALKSAGDRLRGH